MRYHLAHFNGQTDLKVDSLSFLTLINKVQSHLVGGLRGLCFQVTRVKVALEQEYASVSKIACCWECFSCFTIPGRKLFPTRIYSSLFTIIPMKSLMNTRGKLGKVNLCKILLGLLLRRGK